MNKLKKKKREDRFFFYSEEDFVMIGRSEGKVYNRIDNTSCNI